MKEFLYFLFGALLVLYILDIRNTHSSRNELTAQINKLSRQAARYTTAARQDKNSMITVLHANYGAAYLWALKDIATDTQIEKVMGIELSKFENEIIKTQDFATKQMASICKDYAPTSSYLTKISGEG